jgi:predicted CopG family antitoxin
LEKEKRALMMAEWDGKVYIVVVYIMFSVVNMTKTISISDENHRRLLKVCGYLQERNGNRKKFDDALEWMFSKVGYETEIEPKMER